jgi:hypothetical protein
MAVLKLRVVVQSETSVPCTRRARQNNRVAGCRSKSGVYDVVPEPSGIPVCLARTGYGPEDDVVEKSFLSDTWNS